MLIIIINTLTVLVLTFLFGYFGLPYIRRLHLGQTVRADGPKTHFKKSGTPTFGGLFFLAALLLSALALYFIQPIWHSYTYIIILTLCFGLIGFLDDYIKVRVDKNGLSVRQKTIALTIVCVLFAVWYLWLAPLQPMLYIPFIKKEILIIGFWRYIYLLFIVLYLFFMSNAVNLTDGIDGLASSLMTITSFMLAICLSLLALKGLTSLIAVSLALMAGCLGFLPFNRHPAKIFMGDTGSQALGACFAAIALVAGIPWIMLPLGFIYIAEGLSALLQVIYFKSSGGKRLFKMAPLHHHFELSGWSEKRIVINFSIFAVLCGLVSVLLILI